jgi:hypothetical protein
MGRNSWTSITRPSWLSKAFNSSSVMRTYSSFANSKAADKLLSGHHDVADGTVGSVLDPAPAALVEEVEGHPVRARGPCSGESGH